MSIKKDYYEILGLSRDANSDDIKTAYRKMARKYHPDISKEDNAEKKFKEVQEAYEILIDPNKKSNYDNFGHQSNNGSGFEGFSESNFDNFSDIFNNFFGKEDGNTTKSSQKSNLDERIEMNIDFMDAVLGAKKIIQVVLEDYCHKCNGYGSKNPEDIIVCSNCNGLGYVIAEQRTFFGNLRTQQICQRCQGNGRQIKNKCSTCHGKQTQKYKKTIEVDIPAGIDDNMSLKMPNKGNNKSKNNKPGDLYITFQVKPSKTFKRKGKDIYTEIFITFAKAALGTTIPTETIYGKVNLKIPAGIQSGNKMRLKYKGVADVNKSYLKGHQYVIVNIITPTNLSLEQKKLFQELDEIEQKYQQNKSKSWFF